MNTPSIRRIHHASALILLTALLFCVLFQVGKMGPFRAINPFGDDPYDAVGSIAIQVAFFVSVLTYARALRLRDDPSRVGSLRLILRGNIVVLSAIIVTLTSDAIAAFLHPSPPIFWGRALLTGLAVLFVLALSCAAALAVSFGLMGRIPPAPSLTIADGFEDLWTLVHVPVRRFRALLPHTLTERVEGFHPDKLWSRTPWLNPRTHPWRFAFALGAAAGCSLLLGQMQEGAPPSVTDGFLVAGLFLSIEMAATLLGYLALGRYLGLRAAPLKSPSPRRYVRASVALLIELRKRIPDIDVPFPRAVFLPPDDDVFDAYLRLSAGNAEVRASFFNERIPEYLQINGG